MTTAAALEPFLGSWNGRENIAIPGPGRSASAEAGFEIADVAGIGVSVAYTRRRDDRSYAGRGFIAGDGWWWFDTAGAVPAEPGTARLVDEVLVLDRSSDGVRTVVRLSIQDGNLVQMCDVADPHDGPLQPAVRGAYVRAGAAGADDVG